LVKYNKAIIDEAQRVPELFSYIQVKTDQDNITGQYILSGSQNFLLSKNISQSLAGRVNINKLLPFSIKELWDDGRDIAIDDFIYTGGYPRIYDKNIKNIKEYYDAYIQTYLNKDINDLLNIHNAGNFEKFLKLLALRVGQPINLSSLASDTGISVNTVKSWMSLLESSYIIYLLQPYYKKVSARLVKSPKLYFYDTGLLCALLGFSRKNTAKDSDQYGNIFENFVINEFTKFAFNHKLPQDLYYVKDNNNNELDLIRAVNGSLEAYEIKSGITGKSDFANQVNNIAEDLGVALDKRHIIYGGSDFLSINDVDYIPVKDLFNRILSNIS
jgi:predicted AAA+ superfamily ATPase